MSDINVVRLVPHNERDALLAAACPRRATILAAAITPVHSFDAVRRARLCVAGGARAIGARRADQATAAQHGRASLTTHGTEVGELTIPLNALFRPLHHPKSHIDISWCLSVTSLARLPRARGFGELTGDSPPELCLLLQAAHPDGTASVERRDHSVRAVRVHVFAVSRPPPTTR